MPEPACVETARSSDDDVTNAAIVDMAAHAAPDKLVPVLIMLIEKPVGPGVNAADRALELAPYQGPLTAQLKKWGAENIERFWLTNSVAASVPAKHLAQVLCVPHVVRIESSAAYWDIVEPPWGADEAGALECPLNGKQCPAHCFDFDGVPYDATIGCFRGRERVACSKHQSVISDGAVSCFQHVASGKPYLFFSFVPIEPNFIGWRPCKADMAVQMCGP